VNDLWPDEFGMGTQKPPFAILREQADRLATKTKGLVEGLVTTEGNQSRLFHVFYLRVPSMEGYTYRLLRVTQPLDPWYPLHVSATDSGGKEYTRKADSEEQFIAILREILSSEGTKRIMAALLANAQAATA
jgi:hypothetical protein